MAGERGAGRQSSRRSTFSVTPAAPSGAPALGALTGHAAFSRPSQRPPAQQARCSSESGESMAGAPHVSQVSQRVRLRVASGKNERVDWADAGQQPQGRTDSDQLRGARGDCDQVHLVRDAREALMRAQQRVQGQLRARQSPCAQVPGQRRQRSAAPGPSESGGPLLHPAHAATPE